MKWSKKLFDDTSTFYLLQGDRGDIGPQGPPGVKGDAPTRKQLDMCCNTLGMACSETFLYCEILVWLDN